MREVIILNGAPQSGKGEFVKAFGPLAEHGSMVNGVKQIASSFGWDGVKDAAGRKLLFDIMTISMGYNKAPIREVVNFATRLSNKTAIIDIRNPDNIRIVKGVLSLCGVKCTTVLVRCMAAEKALGEVPTGDIVPEDCATAEYKYDVTVYNNGTLKEFGEEILKHFGRLISPGK